MAVGKLFNTLTFGGVNSGDYDVYITGAGVYDAPARDVEMVTIPGRNGQYAVDQGRFEQIEVTYPAAIAKKSAKDFASTIREFRNALASQIGYQRLEDDYNPDEFRLGVFSSGIEVKPNFKRTGEFDITFSCQPQRFLKVGEQDITLTESGTINNPYPYTARPLYKMYGTGEVRIGESFALANTADPIGEQVLSNGGNDTAYTVQFDVSQYHAWDTVTTDIYFQQNITGAAGWDVTGYRFTDKTLPPGVQLQEDKSDPLTISYRVTLPESVCTFVVSEEKFIEVYIEGDIGLKTKVGGGSSTSYFGAVLRIKYDGEGKLVIRFAYEMGPRVSNQFMPYTNKIVGTSSISSIGEPLYFDVDNGEAYTISADGTAVSRNSYARLGIKMPVLLPGDTAVDMDDTVAELDVEPRWWIV